MYISSTTEKLIAIALDEDLGTGDVTTQSVVTPDARVKGHFIAKEPGVICGMELVRRVFELLDHSVEFIPSYRDGKRVKVGDIIAKIEGSAPAILAGERVALNFLQHLSGIATKTASLVEMVKEYPVRIVDTRKTTPGMRVLEKYAVKCGGGYNHRMNLAGGILIKDNHIKAAGSIRQAVAMARENAPRTLRVEVETENLDQVQQALDAGTDIIMLDNMSLENMALAVKLINGRALSEASGNMDQKDLADVARTGVDMISVGALTHSVKALDISLRFV